MVDFLYTHIHWKVVWNNVWNVLMEFQGHRVKGQGHTDFMTMTFVNATPLKLSKMVS